jgi:hypothetical protein
MREGGIGGGLDMTEYENKCEEHDEQIVQMVVFCRDRTSSKDTACRRGD